MLYIGIYYNAVKITVNEQRDELHNPEIFTFLPIWAMKKRHILPTEKLAIMPTQAEQWPEQN